MNAVLCIPPRIPDERIVGATEMDIDKKVAGWLWSYWRDELLPLGITWPRFLHYGRSGRQQGFLRGGVSWEELVQDLIDIVQGTPEYQGGGPPVSRS